VLWWPCEKLKVRLDMYHSSLLKEDLWDDSVRAGKIYLYYTYVDCNFRYAYFFVFFLNMEFDFHKQISWNNTLFCLSIWQIFTCFIYMCLICFILKINSFIFLLNHYIHTKFLKVQQIALCLIWLAYYMP